MGALESEFRRSKKLADAALSQLNDTDLFAAVPKGSNSVATIMKHMSGNMLSRWRDFLISDGEKPDRDRDSEFVISDSDDQGQLNVRWEKGWKTLFDTLGSLRDEDLSSTVYIRGEPHTVLQAIGRQLTHYAYHTGQLVHLAKALVGSRWQTPSIAKGESAKFNRNPTPYLEGDA